MSVAGKHCQGHSVIQILFYVLSLLDGNYCINNWENNLIDKGHQKQETSQRELFGQCKLDKFVPHGLNERVVDFEWI